MFLTGSNREGMALNRIARLLTAAVPALYDCF
jgi:hypothetical protein